MPFKSEPLTDEEIRTYEDIAVGANAHHKTHGAGIVTSKDDTGVTIEIFNSVSSTASSRSFRNLIENNEERDVEPSRERFNTMVIKVPPKVIVDPYGAWKIDKDFGRVLLKHVTNYLLDTPSFIDLRDIPKPMPTGDFSRRIKELRAVNYNDTETLMQYIAKCVDYAAFTWARETSKAPVEERLEEYQKALETLHNGDNIWLDIVHPHVRNTDSERKVVESMLLNITNKSVEDIFDYDARHQAAIKISAAIEKRISALLSDYVEEQFHIAEKEASELANV